jgi:predicted nuclease of predicted toxin-antitoxin system
MTELLLDEMYPPALARQLRDQGHDVLAALDLEVGLSSRSDEDVLAWAARCDRCVVTGSALRGSEVASGFLPPE